MTKQFKSIIFFPTIFVVALLGALTAGNSYLAYLIYIFLVFEHLYFWNKCLESRQNYEFRIFFSEQYLNIYY